MNGKVAKRCRYFLGIKKPVAMDGYVRAPTWDGRERYMAVNKKMNNYRLLKKTWVNPARFYTTAREAHREHQLLSRLLSLQDTLRILKEDVLTRESTYEA